LRREEIIFNRINYVQGLSGDVWGGGKRAERGEKKGIGATLSEWTRGETSQNRGSRDSKKRR
jgi:hypothetical protein